MTQASNSHLQLAQTPEAPQVRQGEPGGCDPAQPQPKARAGSLLPLDARPCTLAKLTPTSCRWPVGDPKTPQFRFCGADRGAHHAYCPAHRALAYSPRAVA